MRERGIGGDGVKVELAGGLAIEADRRVEEDQIPGRRARLAFGVLILENGRAVSREELAAALWGESLPASWAPSLREVMSKVRAFLAAAGLPARETLTSAYGCYQLNLPRGSEVDVEVAGDALARAEAADEPKSALAAARVAEEILAGELLPGFEGDWLESKRRELADIRIQALEIMAESLLELGRGAEAVRIADKAIELNRFSDRSHLLLIRAHVVAGERAEALRAYDSYRRFMANELGVGPSDELEAEFSRLLGGQGEHDFESREGGPLGRDLELKRLTEGLDEVAEGSGRMVMVAGPAGIGKSTLIGALADLARERGFHVLIGVAEEAGMAPLGPVISALGSNPEVPGPGAGDSTMAAEAFSRSLADLVERGPLLCVIEDLHLADPSTLAALLEVSQRGMVPPGVMLIGTGRPGGPTRIEDSEQLLEELMKSDRLDLGPIEADDLPELAERHTVHLDGRMAAALQEWSGGNPFRAVEALRYMAETGVLSSRFTGANVPLGDLPLPPSLDEVVFLRFSRLPQSTRRLLESAAVAGDGSDHAMVAAISDRDESAVAQGIEPAIEAGFIVEDLGSDTVRFVHDIQRQVIVDRIPRSRLRALHAAAATTLEDRGDVGPERLADHLAEATPGDPRGVIYTRLAGERAMEEAAFIEAVAWFRVALEQDLLRDETESSRLDLLLLLARALKLNGEVARAEEVYLEAAELARGSGRHERLAEVSIEFAGFNRFEPSISPASVMLLEEASSNDLEDLNPRVAVGLIARRAQFAGAMGEDPEVDAITRKALQLASDAGDRDATLLALGARLHALGGPDKAEERLEVADRLLADASVRKDIESEGLGLEHRIWALVELGRYSETLTEIDRFAGLSARVRIPQLEMFAAQFGAFMAMIEGRFEDCDRYADLVGEAAARSADPRMAESSRVLIQLVPRLLQGTYGTLAPAIEAIYRWQPEMESFAGAHAMALMETGRPVEAEAELNRLVDSEDLGPAPHGSLWTFNFFFHASLAFQLRSAASGRIFELGLPYAGMHCVYRGFVYLGTYDHHLGRLAAAMGDKDRARQYLRAALLQYEDLGADPWLELTQGDLASFD